MTNQPVLDVQDLRTYFHDRKTVLKAVDGVSLSIQPGEVLGLVGESGCGKSTLALSILNLVPHPGYVNGGRVLFKGRNVLEMNNTELRDLRGHQISMIFQDPIAGLNPVLSIGEQVQEIITAHRAMPKAEARQMAVNLLASMGLADPERISKRYPFQLSGGMAQRVMIAIAMALKPAVLIADEPTSALDMTVQAQILHELRQLRDRGVAILLITHDMGVIAQMADRVAVMYAGRLAEEGSPELLFKRPRHPYTWALLESLPHLHHKERRLRPVQGRPPDMTKLPEECAFLARCPKALNQCRVSPAPPLEEITAEPGHFAACYNPVYQPDDDDEDDL